MSAVQFPHLFRPFTIRGVTLRNRIMSTGHETGIVDATGINDALVAYHRTRAAGGAGLIVIEVASVHPSATFVRNSIKLYRDEAISGYRRLADAAHENGAVLFAQLFHPGRQFTYQLHNISIRGRVRSMKHEVSGSSAACGLSSLAVRLSHAREWSRISVKSYRVVCGANVTEEETWSPMLVQ